MAQVLADLLGADDSVFSLAMQQLEDASGRPSIDVRFIAELETTVRQKTKELGLDPRDTTPKELYHALQALIAKHDHFLVQVLGGKDPDNVIDLLPRIKDCVDKLDIPKTCWAIRHSVAKRLLKAQPPKRVMKQLGYKSIDSMLKREAIGEIYGAVRFMESTAWQTKLVKSYRKLTPSDFESRPVEIFLLDKKRWGESAEDYIYEEHHNITHLKELGVILILPLPFNRLRGVAITMLPLLIHYINEIRIYSAFFKLQQVKPHFADIVIETILIDPDHTITMAGQKAHWRIIQQHFGGSKRTHPELFEPHVQPEDLAWRTAESVLYFLEPALKFWDKLDFVATPADGPPVSLSLLDNAISYCNHLDYGNQFVGHMQSSLWNELFSRYMGEEALERQILTQLNSELIDLNAAGKS